MDNSIHYILFVSSATRLFTDTELHSMLETCRANNTRRDITGLLLYYEGSFIEIIEGPEKVVNWLYTKRILRDRRHQNVMKLLSGFEDKRSFPSWSMGFKRVDKTLIDKKLPNFTGALETRTDPENCFPQVTPNLLIFLRSFYTVSGLGT